ncbi:hypothetical protein ACFRAQ_35175 [Nocardia sp. NPDC056611]|uniref:LtfC-like domain-containing protein n=1 Tax=Nocardia sp. NPDC056611 TaxID=3345877 RepID=UPI003671D8F5
MAGRSAKEEDLILIIGDDYEWYYDWKPDGADNPAQTFPTGAHLFYRFKDGPGNSWTGGTTWAYTISGSRASIKVESETTDAMADRTPYVLMYQNTTTTPVTDKTLALGIVARQKPIGG